MPLVATGWSIVVSLAITTGHSETGEAARVPVSAARLERRCQPIPEMTSAATSGRLRQSAFHLVAVCASAAATVLAFPPTRLRAFAFVALVPLLVAIRRSSLGSAMLYAGLWGMLGAYGVTHWLPGAVARYYDQPVWLGATLFLTASFVMGAVEYMVFGAVYWWAGRRKIVFLPLVAAAAWVVAELGRSQLLTGNPWGLLGYTLAGVSRSDGGPFDGIARLMTQSADLGGVYAVSFLLVGINASLAEIWIVARSGQRRSRGFVEAAVPFALAVAALIYGSSRSGEAGDSSRPAVRIGIAQGNVDLGSQWREDLYGRNLDVYLELTHRLRAERPLSIVFWPENAMTFFVDTEPVYRAAIARVTRDLDVELIAGAPRFESRASTVYFNSAFVLGSDASVQARYDKSQLLPFAEYFPFGSMDFMRRSFARVREFTRGAAADPVPTRAGPAGITICNEAMFPQIAARHARNGASYLVNLSNDTWIDSHDFAEHQLQLVSLRAVEQRRYLVRASTSGPSAVIAPDGTILARTDPSTQTVLTGEIRPSDRLTFYGRHGDAFAYACVAFVGALPVAARLRRRRSPPATLVAREHPGP